MQTDIKKIIAYSSISHLGYVMLGLVSLDLIGIQGAIIQMVSHGLIAAGLFLMVGMIYERCHTRELAAYGGLAKLLPVYSVFFMILTLASIGLPTTSGFTGEFLVLLGAFGAAWPPYQQTASTYPLVLAVSAVGRRRARRALHALVRAALPVRRAPRRRTASCATSAVRERAILGDHRRRGVRARPLSAGADAQDRARGAGVPEAGQHRRGAPLGRDRARRAPASASARLAATASAGREARDELARTCSHRHAAGAPAAGRDRGADRPRDRHATARAVRLLLSLLAAVVAAAAAAPGSRRPATRRRRFPGQYSVTPEDLLAKAIVLALAVPVLLISRDDFRRARASTSCCCRRSTASACCCPPTASSRCSSGSS